MPDAGGGGKIVEHAAFVRALARSLLADRARAEDVAQEALLAALERPSAEGIALRTWLGGAVRNLVRLVRRRDERRARREAIVAAGEGVPSAADSALRIERLQRILAAVERLEEPGRATVLLRFYDGLPPRRIAARMGVPVNTVRTRLQRALARLRSDLARDFASDEGGWLGALAWLAQAPRPAPFGPLDTADVPLARSGPIVAGGVIVGTTAKWLIGASAAALLTTAAWLAWPEIGARTGTDAVNVSSTPALPATADLQESATEPIRADVPFDPSAAAPAEGPATDWRLRPGRVQLRGRLVADPRLLARWSSPLVATAQREVLEEGQLAYRDVVPMQRSDVPVRPDGSFVAELEVGGAIEREIGRVVLVGRDPHFQGFERHVHVPERSIFGAHGDVIVEVTIAVFPAAAVSGRVVDASGKGVAVAVVGLFAVKEGRAQGTPRGETRADASGRFLLPASCEGAALLVAAEQPWSWKPPLSATLPATEVLQPAGKRVELASGSDDQDVGELVLKSGVTIRGHVELEGQGAVAGARVAVSRALAAAEPSVTGLLVGNVRAQDGARAGTTAWTDGYGDFVAGGLAPGKWRVTAEGLAEWTLHPTMREEMAVVVDAPCDDLELVVRGARVTAELRHAEQPVPGALVWFWSGSATFRAGRDGEWRTDALGRASIVLSPGARFNVSTTMPGFEEVRRDGIAPATGEVQTVVLELKQELRHPAFAFRVRGPGGAPIHRCGLRLNRDGITNGASLTLMADDGRFLVENVEPGHYELDLRPGGEFDAGQGCFSELHGAVDVSAGRLPELFFDAVPAGRLFVSTRSRDGTHLAATFELRDAGGRPVPIELFFRLEQDGQVMMLGRADDVLREGACLVDPPLASGRYSATIRCGGFVDQDLDLEIVAGRCTDLDVVLESR